MKVYAQIKKGKYIDSLETLFSSSVLNEQPGVDVGYVGMATASFKDILAEIGLMTEEIDGCGDNDYVIVARQNLKRRSVRLRLRLRRMRRLNRVVRSNRTERVSPVCARLYRPIRRPTCVP